MSTFSERFNSIKEKQQPESTPEFLQRNLKQQAARTAETIIGFPGNLKKAFQQTRDVIGDIFGGSGESLSQLEEKALGKPKEGSFEDLVMNLPSSQELRENMTPTVAKNTGGSETYLEPRSKKEKFAGELNQDLTSFFMPGTGQLRMAVRIGAPIAGNLAKEGIKYLGGDESTAEKAKLGVMLATTLAGQSNPGQFAGQRITEAKSMIPDTATVHVGNLANRLMPLYNRMMRGLGVPSKSRAIQGMQDLAGQVQNNRMNFRSLLDARDNVNEWISEAGGWDVPVPTRDATLRNLRELKRGIIDTIDENMSQRFPQAGELYRTGYEAAAVNHQSNAISNFIQRNFGRKAASAGAKLLFPAIAGGATILPKAAIAGAALVPAYNVAKVLYRIGQSPTLNRYYQGVIYNSLQGNAPAMVKSMSKLDKELEKEEKKESKGKPESMEDFKAKFKKKNFRQDHL